MFALWSDLAALYDDFKVKSVKLTFRPAFNALSTDNLAANYDAYFHTILDFDSPATSTFNRGSVQQYRNMRRTSLRRIHSRTWHPKALSQQTVLDNAGLTGVIYRPMDGWFDTAQPPQFNNLYYYIDPMLADTPIDMIQYNVEITAHVICRNVR